MLGLGLGLGLGWDKLGLDNTIISPVSGGIAVGVASLMVGVASLVVGPSNRSSRLFWVGGGAAGAEGVGWVREVEGERISKSPIRPPEVAGMGAGPATGGAGPGEGEEKSMSYRREVGRVSKCR